MLGEKTVNCTARGETFRTQLPQDTSGDRGGLESPSGEERAITEREGFGRAMGEAMREARLALSGWFGELWAVRVRGSRQSQTFGLQCDQGHRGAGEGQVWWLQ